MIKLKNTYGDVYYMTAEKSGMATSTEYTEIYLYSEELGKDYGDYYRNATNGSQPNIWTPYTLTDSELIVYNDYSKRIAYKYTIVE